MLNNYFKIAVRQLLRYRQHALINILGLSIGVCCCVLIMLYVKNEISFDRFHSKADHIYRIWQHEKYQGEDFINVFTPIPMGSAVKEAYPEVAMVCRIEPVEALVKAGNISYKENIRLADPTFFSMFDFDLLEGSRTGALESPQSIVISSTLAKKYFGTTQAIGKLLELELPGKKQSFSISAVTAPVPGESSIQFDVLLPASNVRFFHNEKHLGSWFNIFNETYVLLKPGISAPALEKKFPALLKQQLGESYRPDKLVMHLQPFKNIHLDTELAAGIEPTGNPKYLYILSTIGLLILIVACINFVTLSVGRSVRRAMEVGIRKTLGAGRGELIRQFWGEALLLTILAVITGLVFAMLLLGPFNSFTGKHLLFHADAAFIAFMLLLTVFIALIAGIYPAIVLSAFRPVRVLKGTSAQPEKAGLFRQSLVAGQFVVSIGMIICTLVVGEQMRYLRNKDLGYNTSQLVTVSTNKVFKEGLELAAVYSQELTKHSQVQSVACSIWTLAEPEWGALGYTDDHKKYREFRFNAVDAHFLPAMQIRLSGGRNFSDENTADRFGSVLVNESFVREFGLKDPVGKKLPGPYSMQIIGVMKDFNYEPLRNRILPLVFAMRPDSLMRNSENISIPTRPRPQLSIRLAGNISTGMTILKDAWKKSAPNQDFDYHFLDERLAAVYRQEEKISALVRLASLLSVCIACMGLLGLVTLMVSRRTKEIGVRKVFGATAFSIIRLISKDFIVLVGIASVISMPLAGWALSRWLSDFAYHIQLPWWAFAAGCSAIAAIAFSTVGLQCLRASALNPARSLRTE